MDFNFNQTHFELFGLDPRFRIDVARLDNRYRDIQSQVHPDKFAHASDVEKRLSMQWATHANEAYQTLKSPLQRARYLLHLNGVSTQEETNTAMSPDFLLQQMEWREGIGDAKMTNDVDALEHLQTRLRHETLAMQERLAKLIDDEKKYEAAAEQVRMLRFMEKLREEINDALESIDA
jgi:molecular chaperone HscB